MERNLPELYQKISRLILQIISQKIDPRDASGGFSIIRNYMTIYINKNLDVIIKLPYEIKEEYEYLDSLINHLITEESFIKTINDFINNYFNSSNYVNFGMKIIYS